MVASPSSSPLHKRNSNLEGGGTAGKNQLLHELEALSQALYYAQPKTYPPQNYLSQAPPQPQSAPSKKQHSFLLQEETLNSRHFSSHGPSTDVLDHIPFSALSSFRNVLSRHSSDSPQAPHSLNQPNPGATNSDRRYSSSVLSSRDSSTSSAEKPEIRSRRLSLQPWQANKSTPQEPDLLEDPLESSHSFNSLSEKKKGVWSWKPFRALLRIGRKRLHCVFSAHIHAIEGLPPALNGLRFCVHVRKEETKDGSVQTMPSRAFQGIAEFQETLFMKCTIYANKGPSNTIKLLAKEFVVYVFSPDITELDFGKHQLDLSRLVGGYIDDRTGQLEKGGSWDTALDLSGKARGGKLVVTFNFEILDKDSASLGNVSSRFRDSPPHRSFMHTLYSLPSSAHGTPRTITAKAHLSHSPTSSEPGTCYTDFLSIDQLNLDEPPSVSDKRVSQTVQGSQAVSWQTHEQLTPPEVALNAFTSLGLKLNTISKIDQGSPPSISSQTWGKHTELNTNTTEERETSSEDEADFVVVEQGIEVGAVFEQSLYQAVEAKEMNTTEVQNLDDLTRQVVEKEALDYLSQKVGEMEAFGNFPVEVVEIEALDDFSSDEVDTEVFNELDSEVAAIKAHDDLNAQVLENPSLQVLEVVARGVFTPEVLEDTVEEGSNYEFNESRDSLSGSRVISLSNYEVHDNEEAKVVIADEGEKKDIVTSSKFVQCLDSRVEVTDAKKLPCGQGNLELESSSDRVEMAVDYEVCKDGEEKVVTLGEAEKKGDNVSSSLVVQRLDSLVQGLDAKKVEKYNSLVTAADFHGVAEVEEEEADTGREGRNNKEEEENNAMKDKSVTQGAKGEVRQEEESDDEAMATRREDKEIQVIEDEPVSQVGQDDDQQQEEASGVKAKATYREEEEIQAIEGEPVTQAAEGNDQPEQKSDVKANGEEEESQAIEDEPVMILVKGEVAHVAMATSREKEEIQVFEDEPVTQFGNEEDQQQEEESGVKTEATYREGEEIQAIEGEPVTQAVEGGNPQKEESDVKAKQDNGEEEEIQAIEDDRVMIVVKGEVAHVKGEERRTLHVQEEEPVVNYVKVEETCVREEDKPSFHVKEKAISYVNAQELANGRINAKEEVKGGLFVEEEEKHMEMKEEVEAEEADCWEEEIDKARQESHAIEDKTVYEVGEGNGEHVKWEERCYVEDEGTGTDYVNKEGTGVNHVKEEERDTNNVAGKAIANVYVEEVISGVTDAKNGEEGHENMSAKEEERGITIVEGEQRGFPDVTGINKSDFVDITAKKKVLSDIEEDDKRRRREAAAEDEDVRGIVEFKAEEDEEKRGGEGEEERDIIDLKEEETGSKHDGPFIEKGTDSVVYLTADVNLDEEVDLVAVEFLVMLGLGDANMGNEYGSNSISSIAPFMKSYGRDQSSPQAPLIKSYDSEVDSPRAQLLRQFEEEEGGFGFNIDVPELLLDRKYRDEVDEALPSVHCTTSSEGMDMEGDPNIALVLMDKKLDNGDHHLAKEPANWDKKDDKHLISTMEVAEFEPLPATKSMRRKTRAEMLEDAETKALMQEWGLNEEVFASSSMPHTIREQETPPPGKGIKSGHGNHKNSPRDKREPSQRGFTGTRAWISRLC